MNANAQLRTNQKAAGRGWTSLRRAVFPLSILFALPLSALNPARQVSQYGHTAWRLQDGSLPAVPHAVAQTTDGYLWIGTEAGLIRFDGGSFSRWVAPPGNALHVSL